MTPQRMTFLAELSKEELLSLNPWDLITSPNAQAYFTKVCRNIVGNKPRYGIEDLTNEELLHEIYPIVYEAIPSMLAKCAAGEVEPENRDRFIFGSLRRIIHMRLLDQLFASMPCSAYIYLDEVSFDDTDDLFAAKHDLMLPFIQAINSYLESQPLYTPQFLSEAKLATDERAQQLNVMIESLRPHLTPREADVLRSLMLSSEDRSLVALEIGTTPKMISRYRSSIQRKLVSVLKTLNWDQASVHALLGNTRAGEFGDAAKHD